MFVVRSYARVSSIHAVEDTSRRKTKLLRLPGSRNAVNGNSVVVSNVSACLPLFQNFSVTRLSWSEPDTGATMPFLKKVLQSVALPRYPGLRLPEPAIYSRRLQPSCSTLVLIVGQPSRMVRLQAGLSAVDGCRTIVGYKAYLAVVTTPHLLWKIVWHERTDSTKHIIFMNSNYRQSSFEVLGMTC